MKFSIILLYIAMGLFIFGCGTDYRIRNIKISVNPSESSVKITRIAVFPFDAQMASRYEDQGPLMADEFTKELRRIGYDCIDRKTISKGMKEQGLYSTHSVDLNTGIEIGKKLGAQGVLLGSASRNPDKFRGTWIYSLKLVDVETGKVVWNAYGVDVLPRHIAERIKAELNKK